jgi:hypothetical protein
VKGELKVVAGRGNKMRAGMAEPGASSQMSQNRSVSVPTVLSLGGLTRIQLSRKKGWRMPLNTVKVDRTTRWGNYAGRAAADKSLALTAFIDWLDTEATPQWKMTARAALRGKNLACWCKHGQPCHADYLLGWVNADAVIDAPAHSTI